VLVINPGTLAKRRAAGTYARVIVQPAVVSEAEREEGVAVVHNVWKRTRVDIVKI
jgi:DNA polymerase alpha subunit B